MSNQLRGPRERQPAPSAPGATRRAEPASGLLALQRAAGNKAVAQLFAGEADHAHHDRGGLPAPLRAGVEALSGVSMEGVRVHYNSSRPAQLSAAAYTKGAEIHVAPGQEHHLAHEAWHVVQQQQGRVRASLDVNGEGVDPSPSLEREADVMGRKAERL